MKDRDKKSASPVLVVMLVVCVLLLPILYVLSIGPACWLVMNGYVSSEANNVFFTPLDVLMDNCKPPSDFVVWYTALFIEG